METQRVLQLEGRDAKNLIAYSVSNRDDTGQSKTQKPHRIATQ